MDHVINRVIPNFVALCNKLVFYLVFTRVGLKNQVGASEFTLVRLTLYSFYVKLSSLNEIEVDI